MAINLVRKPSETPNINNHDDYRLFRYATGGYNGVVEKYGNECDYEVNGNTFKIKSGEIVIDGVQSKIDASGVGITVDNVTGTEYYTVYCEVNLTIIDNQKSEIKATKSTVNYPVIEKGDDLTQNQAGIARLELYRFVVNSGEIGQVQKIFNIIQLGQSKMAETSNFSDKAKNVVKEINGSYTSLEKDSTNVLKNNNEIIERKIMIYNGDAINPIDLSSYNFVEGDTIEIAFKLTNVTHIDCGAFVQRFTLFARGSKLLDQDFSFPRFHATTSSAGNIGLFSLKVLTVRVVVNAANGTATTLWVTGKQISWDMNNHTGTIIEKTNLTTSVYKIIT